MISLRRGKKEGNICLTSAMSEESLVTDLCTASFSGNLSTIKFILGKGVDVDKRDSTGMTALTRACVAGKSECIKLLLAAHANVNNPDAVS